MILHQAQKKITRDRHRFRTVNCGRRFGKTTLAVEEIKAKALLKPSKIVYIAPTYQQARDIAWGMIKKELGQISKVNESRLELEIRLEAGISRIALRGWESVEGLRGQAFDFMIVDEVAMMRNWVLNWQEVLRPTLTDTKGEVLFISTPKGFNHFYDLCQQEKTDSDYKTFNYTSYDNPHISKEEIQKAKAELTEDRFSQEYLADFRKTEGLVYKEFDRKRHLFSDSTHLPHFADIIVGVDFGYTNPAAVLKIGVDGDNNYWVLKEWYRVKQSDEAIAQLAAQFMPNQVYPDPEAPEKIQKLIDKGLNVREVIKGKDSVTAGINHIRELFKANRIKIKDSLKYLICELETYHYPDWKNQEINQTELPVKKDDHCLDALRYAISTYSPPVPVVEGQEDFNLYKADYS
jgi:PBSX family phage terminase large subunit